MRVKGNWVGAVRKNFRFRCSSAAASPRKTCSMGLKSNLVGAVRRTFGKSPPQEPIIVFNHTNNSESFTSEEEEKEQINEEQIVEYSKEVTDGDTTFINEEEEKEQANEEQTSLENFEEAIGGGDGSDDGDDADASSSSFKDLLMEEERAAITIQTFFRRHLARRAYRALRSIVKLQAAVRGAQVRSQARVALNCMNALVRLQLRIRDRQLLSSSSTEFS
ncbi:hypothetical protein NE237_022229 [Protea cynaroides]|uniref:Uncharacterized protein n=1 Tax=Protea cynaroides TaxID=273540 RepID=A0A9Q0HCT1_9MAGN|nr:hypothetical protein NE237_022229 [Protea cynaroides]